VTSNKNSVDQISFLLALLQPLCFPWGMF